MMKVLHTADWHLGASMARNGPDLRQAHKTLPEVMAALVRRHECDLVLLAGDIFDGPPTREVLNSMKQALASMEVPVCISPGNHDYVTAASVWKTETFPANVHVFTTPIPEALVLPELDCRIYGAGYESMDCPPLLRDFRAEGTERHVIGLFHGDPQVPNSPYCPITAEQVRESGLDYLALGHIHQSGSFRAGDTLCAWPGCPLGRGFDECGEKGVLITTLGTQVQTHFLPLDFPRFYDWTIPVDGDPVRALADALPPAGIRNHFRITLTGSCKDLNITGLKQSFSQYPHLELIDRTTPPVELWATAGEDTLEGLYFQMLHTRMAEDPSRSQQIRLAAKLSRQILDGQEVVLP